MNKYNETLVHENENSQIVSYYKDIYFQNTPDPRKMDKGRKTKKRGLSLVIEFYQCCLGYVCYLGLIYPDLIVVQGNSNTKYVSRKMEKRINTSTVCPRSR